MSHFYFITKYLSQKFDISFTNLQKNIILQNLKQTLTCTNHKFIQQICMRKNYKTTPKQNTYTTKNIQKNNQHFKFEFKLKKKKENLLT
jgi:hypothetical protein